MGWGGGVGGGLGYIKIIGAYVVGTPKNRLNETIILNTKIHTSFSAYYNK